MIQHIESLTTVDYKAKLRQCIHCGLCLLSCPTYVVFGTEMDGPRGRIALMRAVSEGRIKPGELNGTFAKHITRCLACRACETACPSGVKYGSLVEAARITIEHNRTPCAVERFGRWLGLRQLMPRRGPLRFIARLIWLYQVTGLQSFIRAANVLPRTLAAMEPLLPPIAPRYRDYRLSAPALGKKRERVAFFIGCIQEAFLAPVNEATIRVLQRNGYEVHFPQGQTCCGAAQAHVGEDELARELARQNIDAFLTQDFEAIITNAGGCGLTLKEDYPHWLKDDSAYAERARRFSALVKDINEFLADHLRLLPTGEVKARATYSDSCHLRHGQKVVQAPRDLLKLIPGLQLVELKHPDQCCGSAGIYNIIQVDTANAVLKAKMADIAATGADLIVTSNPGCHLQLIAGVRHAALRAKVMHIAEVLDWSYTVAED